MNKQQKDYLINKIVSEGRSSKLEFASKKPTNITKEELVVKLARVGLSLTDNGYGARYIVAEPTAQHKRNKEAIEAYTAKVDELVNNTVDTINLGDSKDALEILKEFNAQLKATR